MKRTQTTDAVWTRPLDRCQSDSPSPLEVQMVACFISVDTSATIRGRLSRNANTSSLSVAIVFHLNSVCDSRCASQ